MKSFIIVHCSQVMFWPAVVVRLEPSRFRAVVKLNMNGLVVVFIVALVVFLLVTHCRPETCDDVVFVQVQYGLNMSTKNKHNDLRGWNSSDAGVPWEGVCDDPSKTNHMGQTMVMSTHGLAHEGVSDQTVGQPNWRGNMILFFGQ
jgi:hypothetical protein